MREFWFESGQTRLFAMEAGTGPLIVMLHGGMADHRAVRPFVSGLADDFRVVTPDLRGSGKSWFGGNLAFDQLADDVVCLLDHLGVGRAVVGGVSGGTGVALRVALRYPDRVCGLGVIKPIYAGEANGYTDAQAQTFAMMDELARRAPSEGIQVLYPLYQSLPEAIRERALAMVATFDPASTAATSRFLASGAQPFRSEADLAKLDLPALLVGGDDPTHPASVSELYAASLRRCTFLPASTVDVAGAVRAFADECNGV